MPHSIGKSGTSKSNTMGNDEQWIIVRWMTLYCSSNSELATLSNVSRSWRKIVSETLINLHNRSESDPKQYPVEHLLLPCMAQDLSNRRRNQLVSSNGGDAESNKRNNDENSTFCLAWFAPKGIQLDSICLNDDSSSDSSTSSQYQESNTNGLKYNRDDEIVTRFSNTRKNWKTLNSAAKSAYASSPLRSSSNHGRTVDMKNRSRRFGMALGSDKEMKSNNASTRRTIAKAWLGYKNAMDVLIPFGYTNDLVRVRPFLLLFLK